MAGSQPKGISYALVARGPLILAEWSSVQGNAGTVALSLLEKLAAEPAVASSSAGSETKSTFLAEGQAFHVLVSSGLIYLCMADEALGKAKPFLFLGDVAQRFTQRFGAVAGGAVAYEMSSEFGGVLAARATFYSGADTLGRVRGEVADLKNVMVDSIERILDRGERLELLVAKTDNLGEQAVSFKRSARHLRRQLWWRNARLAATIGGLVLLSIYILISVICSPTFHC